ncbi:MAG: ABC transporter substrate-binding protein [Proteobacteria bacterium]|nr:ABC transporter substrate-binding protein [Pseudomonadota bacterium]MBI3499780.1 ABC transporter substrate-binding protein [Pseudomonadota bacterium]
MSILANLRRLSIAAGLGALALSASVTPALAQSNVLKVVPNADLRLLDPVQTVTLITRMHGTLIYEALFAWDSKFESKPMMAESYTVSPDGRSYRFTLRPGLKFHDGQPVTAADVVPSLKRWITRGQVGGELGKFVKDWQIHDQRSFTLTLNEPFGLTIFLLGGTTGTLPIVMRAKDAAVDAFTPITEAVGSGPFKFNRAEWVPGSRTVYDKNTDYVPRGEPTDGLAGARLVKVDRVEYVVIPDAATQVAALSRGEVDFLDQPRIDLMPQLAKNPQVVVDTLSPLDTYAHMRPNHLVPPFNNPKARLALAASVFQPDYLNATAGDQKLWRECRSYFICGGPEGTEAGAEDFKKPNPERAKQLLAEAGYKGEPVVLLSTTEIPTIYSLSQVAAAQLKAIGINVDLQLPDWGTTVARTQKKDPASQGGWNLFVTTAGGVYAQNPLLNSNIETSCEGKNNVGWPCDEQAEKLRGQWVRTADAAQRKVALEALHRRLWEVQPTVLLGQFNPPSAWRANLKGVLKMPINIFWNIEKGS